MTAGATPPGAHRVAADEIRSSSWGRGPVDRGLCHQDGTSQARGAIRCILGVSQAIRSPSDCVVVEPTRSGPRPRGDRLVQRARCRRRRLLPAPFWAVSAAWATTAARRRERGAASRRGSWPTATPHGRRFHVMESESRAREVADLPCPPRPSGPARPRRGWPRHPRGDDQGHPRGHGQGTAGADQGRRAGFGGGAGRRAGAAFHREGGDPRDLLGRGRHQRGRHHAGQGVGCADHRLQRARQSAGPRDRQARKSTSYYSISTRYRGHPAADVGLLARPARNLLGMRRS